MPARFLALIAVVLVSSGCKKPGSAAPAGGAGKAVADSVAAPSLAALKAADASLWGLDTELADLLNGVTDEASARTAATKIRALAPTYATAGKTRLQLIAVLDSTHKSELDAYLSSEQEKREKTPSPLVAATDRAVAGPFFPPLQGAINAILDAGLEQVPGRQKQWQEEYYRKKGWRK